MQLPPNWGTFFCPDCFPFWFFWFIFSRLFFSPVPEPALRTRAKVQGLERSPPKQLIKEARAAEEERERAARRDPARRNRPARKRNAARPRLKPRS